MNLRNSPVKWALLLPGLVVMFGITFTPIAQAVIMSFRRWKLTESPEPGGWVGFENYARAINDENFWNSIWVTTSYSVVTAAISLALGLWIAVSLTHSGPWGNFLKATLVLPFAIPLVLRGYSYRFMLLEGDGVFDVLIDAVFPFLSEVVWLSDPSWALFWLAAPTFWAWGPLSGLMLLGALNNIPEEIFEAAELDGSRPFHTFRTITFPLLRPMVLVVSLLVVLFSVAMFDLVETMTKGGPGRATETLNYFIFRIGFSQFDIGYSSALAVILTLGLGGLAYLYTRLLKV
jgi:multiple sugar transport system permease protein